MAMTVIISGHTCRQGPWAKHVGNPFSPWEHVEPVVHGVDHFNNQLPWHLGKWKCAPDGLNSFFDCFDLLLNFWYVLIIRDDIQFNSRCC